MPRVRRHPVRSLLTTLAPLALAPLTLAPVAAVAVGGGCMFQNASPQVKLQDAVHALNDAARWSRLDVAIDEVRPDYRPRFAASRRAWGRAVHIADSEIVSIRMDDDGATSRVEVRWYRVDSTTIRRTLVEQRWHRDGRDFALREEVIADGDPDLLEGVGVELPPDLAPLDEAEGTAGGEGAAGPEVAAVGG